MRIKFKLIFSFFSNLYFKLIFSSFIKRNIKSYVVIDIDNTIADTWKVLYKLKGYKSYELIPTLNGTIREIKDKYDGMPKIFLSNRNIFTYSATSNWLLKHKLIDEGKDLLILTSFPEQKLYYLNKLVRNNSEVFYYDDLSYNHENGKVEFYDHIITKVKKIDLKYFDYSYIVNLNSND
ncbi:hypothetical protein [Sediminibacterium sp.]|uniref:hypothetical protein n=1 Tax=Sediminibacterium sp. TaxID=1917865 RepID=UPI003F6EA2D2